MNRFLEFFKSKKQAANIPINKMSAAIAQWSALYENKYFSEGSGSLNLAAAVCQELARLSTIELESQITGDERAEYLNEQYQSILKKARVFVEYACAKGGVILKPFVYNGRICTSIVQADGFIPISFSPEGELTGAVFYDYIQRDTKYYTRLEEHKLRGNEYLITNTAYEGKFPDDFTKEVPLSTIPEWAELENSCRIENVTRPLFSYLKMPSANTVDCNSGLGVSAFCGAVGLIHDAYAQYENLLWEFESGKRALFIDECAVRQDEEGNAELPEKRLYRMLSTGDDTLFEDWSPEMREGHILSGLDRILRSIEFNCGLAYGTLSDLKSVDKTAEEIKASKQRSYATVCDIQNALKKALYELIEVMDIFCDIYSLAPKGEYSVSFNLDDSIICDRSAEFGEKITLLDKNIIAPWEMRTWYMNEEEAEAKRMIGEINELHRCNNMA